MSELNFVDLRGRRQSWHVDLGPTQATPGGVVCARLVRCATGREAIQKWVPSDVAARLPDAGLELENEVRVGYRLLDRFRGGHPAELVEVIGHDLDAPEPFLLIEPPRGRPVVDIAGQLGIDDQDEFERGLFRALQCLADVRLVHGDLSPLTVRWDAATGTVQVTDFAHAAVEGEPVTSRRAAVIPGWTNPPLERFAALAGDVWAAGQVVLFAATGKADPAHLESRGPALRSLLDGAFAAEPAARPTAATMLRRLSASPLVLAAATDADERFDEGCRKFDEAMASKGHPRTAVRPTASALSSAARAGRQLLLVAACVAVLALAVAVAMWGGAL